MAVRGYCGSCDPSSPHAKPSPVCGNCGRSRPSSVSPCRFVFRSKECGYRFNAMNCDKSFRRCLALGNAERFGGQKL